MIFTSNGWCPQQLVDLGKRLNWEFYFYLNTLPEKFPVRKPVYIDLWEPSPLCPSEAELEEALPRITIAYTKYPRLLQKYPNKCFYSPAFSNGIWADQQKAFVQKEDSVSFLLGKFMHEDRYPGYDVRREVWERRGEIRKDRIFLVGGRQAGIACDKEEVLGTGDRDVVFNSMFNICIENCFEVNYFSEKVKDCFATKTVPIYMGCPNIGDFFNMDGILVAKSADHVIELCNNATPELYSKMLPAVEKNFKIVPLKPFPPLINHFLNFIRIRGILNGGGNSWN